MELVSVELIWTQNLIPRVLIIKDTVPHFMSDSAFQKHDLCELSLYGWMSERLMWFIHKPIHLIFVGWASLMVQ